MSKASQRGFTLIELVVVIVILGILAAFAVPRFMGLEGQARAAALQGLAGSVKSAAALAHSVQLATLNALPNTDISIEGGTRVIAMTNGYPTRASIDDMIGDLSGFAYAPATGTFTKQGATNAAQCSFVYTAPATNGPPPTISVPNTGGC
jgi:MSHA pilin protein MshA